MPAPSPWLKAIVKVERTLGGPLARATNSHEGASALLALGRARRLVSGVTKYSVDRGIHLINLPSRRDVQRLDVRVERLHRLLEEVAHSLDDREREQSDGR